MGLGEYRLLKEQELEEWLNTKGRSWFLRNGKLYRQFVFKDFVDCFGFMVKVAIEAERMEHHPEWFNVYNRLEIWLTTHDLGGISTYDIMLAEKIDSLLG